MTMYRVAVVRDGVIRTTDLDESNASFTVREAVASGLVVSCRKRTEDDDPIVGVREERLDAPGTPLGTIAPLPVHRLDDFGWSKSTIRKFFYRDYERPSDDVWSERVKGLLASKRTRFTLSEISDLVDVMNSSHHQCVLDNPDDYQPVVVRTHERLEAKLERAWQLIAKKEREERTEDGNAA